MAVLTDIAGVLRARQEAGARITRIVVLTPLAGGADGISELTRQVVRALDGAGDHVYLAPSMVNLRLTQERFPNIRFLETREIV